MKKILFMLLAFVGFVSSCENDDIEIVKEKAKYNVSLNVATQGMYDEFGITDKIKTDFLRDGSNVIGINTFIYDTSGKLVTSKFDYVNNYNILNMEFEEVEEGNYTILTIETLVNPDNGYAPNFFEINDIEDITKIKLSQKYYKIGSSAVIGVYSNDISVSSDMSLYVTPKAIGSLINVHPYNYEHSPYVKWGIGTNDALDYYFLNPQLPRKSRFYEDLTKRGYVNIRLRADTENSSGYYWSVYVLESSIEWKPVAQAAENDDEEYITWKVNKVDLEDGKTYEAGCYYLYEKNESSYVASYFGDRDGLSDWYNNLNFKVPDAEPYLKWGASANEVTKYMQDCKMKFTYDGTNEDMYYSGWSNPDETLEYEYRFDTSKNNLNSLLMLYSSDAYSMENVFGDLKTKYVNEGYDSELGGYYLHTENYGTELLLFENEGGFGVLYVGSATSNAPKCVVSNTTAKSMLKLKSTMKK